MTHLLPRLEALPNVDGMVSSYLLKGLPPSEGLHRHTDPELRAVASAAGNSFGERFTKSLDPWQTRSMIPERSFRMITGKARSLLRQISRTTKKDPDRFLLDVSGVIHVGANTGQERVLYNTYDLNVLWIEPIPLVFAELTTNIVNFKKQRALQALVTNVDDQRYSLYISNNEGLSSSILRLKQHKDIWPDVKYMDSIALLSTTLVSLLKKERVALSDYQALVMDTQGSELLVLQGSIEILNQFMYIKTEVPNFEAYEGCCQISDIANFMKAHGYAEFSRREFAHREEGGSYYDIVYKKKTL